MSASPIAPLPLPTVMSDKNLSLRRKLVRLARYLTRLRAEHKMRTRRMNPTEFWRGLALLLVAAAVIAGSSPACAQPDNRERVREAIEQTDRILDEARTSVEQSSSQRAALLLKQAEQFQDRAKEAFDEGRLLLAQQWTDKAREAARRCIGSIVDSGDERDFVEQQLDVTDEWLEQVRTVSDNNSAAGLELRLQEAQRLQDRARDLLSENSLRQALLLTRRAQEICRDLVGRFNSGERRRDQLRANLERARVLVDDNRDAVTASSNETARTLFESGSDLIAKAEELYQAGAYDEALRLLAGGLVRVNKALRMITGGRAEDEAARAMQIAEAQMERLQQAAADRNNRVAADLLDEAQQKLERARAYYEQGNHQQALVIVRVVMELNQQAAKILGTW